MRQLNILKEELCPRECFITDKIDGWSGVV